MKTYKTLKNQTIFDLAVQLYGNVAAWEELVTLNLGLRNDYSSAEAHAVAYDPDIFDLAYPVQEGTTITYDTDSVLYKSNVVNEIENEVISFDMIITE